MKIEFDNDSPELAICVAIICVCILGCVALVSCTGLEIHKNPAFKDAGSSEIHFKGTVKSEKSE